MTQKLLFKNSLILLFLILTKFTFAQIGINTNSPNATLHINYDSNTVKAESPPGIIAPTLLLSDLINHRSLYGQPHSGVYVYITNIDADTKDYPDLANITSKGYYFFDGMQWNVFAIQQNEIPLLEPWFSTETNLGATLNTENIFHGAQVGIGKNGPVDPNAQLEITSSSKGLIIPRLTKAERDAIVTPTVSMMIWNTDELCFNFYKGENSGWKSICENSGEADIKILDCLSAKVIGNYIVGTAVTDSEYLQLTIIVNEKGSYNIEGTTDIGIYFQKDGTFPSKGTYTIRIPAYGSPNTAITNSLPEKNIKISINGSITDCEIPIKTVNNQSVRYKLSRIILPNIISESLAKNEPSTNKKVTLKLTVLQPGTTDITATDNNNLGITYHAYNQILESGEQEVILYGDGDAVPNSFNGTQLPFTLSGPGFEYTGNENIFNITITSNEASFTSCTTSSLYGTYIAGTNLTTSNYVNVTVNVATLGTYYYEATTDNNANIKFTASGRFTTTGSQVIRAYASSVTNGPIGIGGSYTFTPKINGIVNCNSFNLDVIHSAKKVLFLGNRNATAQTLLGNSSNFGRNGKFKIENVTTYLDKNPVPTTQQLLNFINVDQYQMIVFPVTMGNYTLTADHYQILANFIKNKKGIVIFTSGTKMQTHAKGIIDRIYPGNSLSFNDTYYETQTTRLPNNTNNATEESYLNGPFGNIKNKYFIGYDNNSWLGVTGNLPEGLKTMVNFTSFTTPRGYFSTARNSFIYTETPGLFIFPGYVTLRDVNGYYGAANPVTPSTAPWSGYPVYMNNGTAPFITTVPTGESIGYLFLGNVFAESFKHIENQYLPNVNITMYP